MKSLSRAGWVMVGLAAAMLLVPTAAVAATLAYNGIEGTNGTSTTQNKALVTSAGQLLTNEANPSSYVRIFHGPDCSAGGIYKIPSGKALIITGADFYDAEATTGTPSELDLEEGPSSAPCTTLLAAGSSSDESASQNQVFQPGIAVPAGDVLGLNEYYSRGSAEFYGYLVPSNDVPGVPASDVRNVSANHSPTSGLGSTRIGST
jgi:hypothetical protein